jgi:hypothetical protein
MGFVLSAAYNLERDATRTYRAAYNFFYQML